MIWKLVRLTCPDSLKIFNCETKTHDWVVGDKHKVCLKIGNDNGLSVLNEFPFKVNKAIKYLS